MLPNRISAMDGRRQTRVVVILVILAMCGGASFALAGEPEPFMAKWSHFAEIRMEQTPGQGIVEVELTPDVFDFARPDLADLRVVAAAEHVGYVLRSAEGRVSEVPLSVKLFNRTYAPGKQSSVTVAFGQRVLKNRVRVVTPGTNFRRKAMVEGSDDGQNWQRIVEDVFLFRIAGGPAGAPYDRSVVALPDNNQRYLRVTVYNGTDDPGRIEIQDVKASRLVRTPPQTARVPIVGSEAIEEERGTEITLDLGYRHLPIHEIELRFSDPNFFRRVLVSGRDRKERIVRTPVEDAPAHEKKVEEPWRHITGGVIYRYSSRGLQDQSLVLSIRGARYRYLRVRVANADDAPLHYQGASVTRLVHYAVFQPEASTRYSLYFGNVEAQKPSYDIRHYIDRLRAEGVHQGALGKAMENPTFGQPEPAAPWSERHKELLWLALLAAVAVLALLIYRMARSAPARADDERGDQQVERDGET